MSDKVICFFNCCEVSREGQLSVMPSSVVEGQSITVKETVQAAYTYMEHAARRIKRWITVTAEWFRCELTCRVRSFVRKFVRNTGIQILRQSAILRF